MLRADGSMGLSKTVSIPGRIHVGVLTWIALAVVIGMTGAHALGAMHVGRWFWFGILLLVSAWGASRLWQGKSMRQGKWVLIGLMAATWYSVQVQYAQPDDIRHYLTDEPQLACVTGRVLGPTRIGQSQAGAFSSYDYRPPVTLCWLELDGVQVGDVMEPASGRLVMKVRVVDTMLTPGDRVQATGWMASIMGPQNLGEHDYKASLARQGVHGRITLKGSGNWQRIEPAVAGWRNPRAWFGRVQAGRHAFATRAGWALNLGLDDAEARSLLERLVLGVRDNAGRQLDESFRVVGLAHVLSISGAHLTILMALLWWLFRGVTPKPWVAARFVGAVLLLYLMAVPWRIPIVRSAIMAGVFCMGYATGRRLPAMDLLGLAAIIVLIWRPGDLTTAGLQLSFGVVAGLLLFTPRIHLWLMPPIDDPAQRTVGMFWRHVLMDAVIVSSVAFAVALPLTAYHFSHISPLAILLSVLAIVPLSLVLAVGFVKTFVGMLFPSASIALAGLAQFFAKVMILLVGEAIDWPGVAWELHRPPSWVWCVLALGFIALGLAGWVFRTRRRRGVWGAAMLVMTLWLVLGDGVLLSGQRAWTRTPPSGGLTLHAIAVGDGSCYLMRSGDATLLYDCGSAAFMAVGQRSVLPALRQLGVTRLDHVILSHSDMDHYAGLLDVAAGMAIGEVLVSEPMLQRMREQADHPDVKTGRIEREGYLWQTLTDLGIPVRAVHQGWQNTLGDAQLEMLWPPADLSDPMFDGVRDNDLSLVLEATIAGRRVRLNGDIQDLGMLRLMATHDAHVIVTDLPHHGSFRDDVSPRWLEALNPQVVLQSSGPARLRNDAWHDVMQSHPDVERYVTARAGMIEVVMDGAGRVTVHTQQRTP